MKKIILMAGALLILASHDVFSQTEVSIPSSTEGNGAKRTYTYSSSNGGSTLFTETNSYFDGTTKYGNSEAFTELTSREVYTFSLSGIPENSIISSAKLVFVPQKENSNVTSKTKITSPDRNFAANGAQNWFNEIAGATALYTGVDNSNSTEKDITSLVQTAYSSQSKKVYLGFVGENESTTNSATTVSSSYIKVKYYPPAIVTIQNSFGAGTLKVDGLTYNSGAQFTWVYNTSHNIEGLNQDIGGSSYTFQNWTDGSGTFTNNPKTILVTTNKTWTANFSAARVVTFANRDGNTIIAGTTLTLNTADNIQSGGTRPLLVGSNNSVKTNHEKLPAASDKKHHHWNSNFNENKTTHNLTVSSNTSTDYAQFQLISPATITPSLDGVPVTGSVEVKDPWFVEANGTQPESWKTYNTGFTPTTMPNGGIFLNEVVEPNKPYYSTRITYSQTTLAGTDAYFQNWSGPAGSIASPTSLETAVIFKSANDVIKANYKGHLRTGAPELADQKNQRRSDGFLTVYESMGEIWLTQVDGYGNWSPEIRLSFGTGTAKNPSLSNWVPVFNGSKAVITWLENGQIFFQPVRFSYSNPLALVRLSWLNDGDAREFNSRPGLLSDSRPVATLYLSGSGLDVWYAYEANTGGIKSGRIVLADSYSSPFMSGLFRNLSGFLSGTTEISTGAGDQYPVLIYQPAASGFAAKKAIYFLASGYASGKRIAEYNLANDVTSVFPVGNSEYTFSSLSGGVNPTSASYALVAAAQRHLAGGVVSYDTEIYQKASYYSVTSLPSLSKIYSSATNPVVMVDNTPYIGSPVYEVNFKQGTNWYKATGGSSLTLIGTNIAGIFASEQVWSGTRKSVVVKTNTSPASLVEYSGSGVLNKGEGTLYADVRSVRNYTTLSGQSKTAILDFAGALVEPVDSLENGAAICAVKLIAPDQNTIIVRQPDSIKTALAIDVIRNGVAIKSYSAGLWDELSINSFDDVQDGDVLVFRLGFPVASSWGYEIYDFNGTNLTKNGEETADAVKLKKLENGVAVYPNPFNPNTSISVSLEAPASVKVMVFNILGQLVSDFGKADLGAGVHTYAFDGKSLASGTYFYRVEIGEKVKTGKLQLLK